MTASALQGDSTLLDALIRSLRACAATPDGVAPPCAILWTDPEGQWLPIKAALLAELPELLILGDFDPLQPERRTGPAIWLRCMIERTLSAPQVPEDRTPILYLPGASRQQLRAGEDCLPALRPLIELMFRGAEWLQKGHHEWTVSAFLTSPHGLALEMARDGATKEALARALPEVVAVPVASLRGRRLEAFDFDRLLSNDVIRDVLRWMADPTGTRKRQDANAWGAFCNRCREELEFDPEAETDVFAGAKLGSRTGPWAKVWERFLEAPTTYPGIVGLLRRSRPGGTLTFDRQPWPDLNDEDEATARRELAGVQGLHHLRACEAVVGLEAEHSKRRGWVWAKMGHSPMALVLEPLARLAQGVRQSIGGATPEEQADVYLTRGWQADSAAWEAVAASASGDETLVSGVVRHLLMPWLDDSARSFQATLSRSPLPGRDKISLVESEPDGCVLFVDGLRYDLGLRLGQRLEGRGCRIHMGRRWAATPTVTATAKPAVTPVADLVSGGILAADFGARLGQSARAANAQNLREALTARGYQIMGAGELDLPKTTPARGWLEAGEIDSLGHKLEGRLARAIEGELDRLVERILELLSSGWKSLRVVTDHGWLLLPGGLPKVDLPKHLTESRWARCAVISGGSTPDVPRYPWFWNPEQSFAYAPGIACFNKQDEYAHGGLSLQECLTPDILVSRDEQQTVRASIVSITWRGLRCFLEVATNRAKLTADLRLKSPSGISVANATKVVEQDGSASLVLSGDEYEAENLVVVLLDENGTILAHKSTRVGAMK